VREREEEGHPFNRRPIRIVSLLQFDDSTLLQSLFDKPETRACVCVCVRESESAALMQVSPHLHRKFVSIGALRAVTEIF